MEDITVEELKRRTQSSEKLNIVDVREVWEHEENNIGGLNIPLGNIPGRLEELESLKDQEVIVCSQCDN